MPVLVDTGVLYAAADTDDGWHKRVRAWLETLREPLLVPVTVLPEITYLLAKRLGASAERTFVASVSAGEVAIESLTKADLERCRSILDEHPAIGFVDASCVAMAERLRLRVLATTDRRHFAAIRPKHIKTFELVP